MYSCDQLIIHACLFKECFMKLQEVHQEKKEIHIGLVLAGAVTAGAYTAGVLDYLLNTLDLWQQEYDKNPNEVAEPNVIIDAITGASAGSIVAAVTVLALATKRYKNVSDPNSPEADKNLLFDTWVNLGLKQQESMTEKLFSTSDLNNGKVKSLLNTSFISDMLEKLMKDWDGYQQYDMPAYIKHDMEILMTLSNLRGLPLELSFSNGDGAIAHTMSYHKAFAYFKLNKKDKDPLTFKLHLDDKDDVRTLLECSRASGAFPVGLKSVPFKDVSKAYIEANLAEIFKGAKVKPKIEEPYHFLAVDGGMTNNEPIAEALRILNPRPTAPPLEEKLAGIIKDSREKGESDAQRLTRLEAALAVEEKANKPIIMIDPFPNFSFQAPKQQPDYLNDGLIHVVQRLYETLRNQVLFKESDIADLFSNDSQKGMIWPTRYKDGKKYRNAIASAALGGFAGFFNRAFLKHDYMLGQKNCQRFLRNYFYREMDGIQWPEKMKKKFAFESEEGKMSLPIIPDYRVESYDPDKKLFLPEINVGDFPKVSYDELILRDLRPKIARRVEAVLDKLADEVTSSKAEPIDHPWLIKTRPGFFGIRKFLLTNVVQPLSIKLGKKAVKGQLNRWITNQIILDMSNHGLFFNDEKEPDNVLN
jgi:predicted acylesterase/phospholipase RssA